MNTGDMEKYCPKPHPVYFNAFSMWQQLSGSVQYLINIYIYTYIYNIIIAGGLWHVLAVTIEKNIIIIIFSEND